MSNNEDPNAAAAPAASQAAPTAQPSQLDRLAGIVGDLAASVARIASAQQAPQLQAQPVTTAPAPATTQPAPVATAAAPTAPTGATNPITTGGLVDIFSLPEHVIRNELGPSGVRQALDKIREFDLNRSGLARLPKPPAPSQQAQASGRRKGYEDQGH